MSGTHKGHIVEFPRIRIDCFTQDVADVRLPADGATPPPAQLYLLTHIHTDHLTGLSSAAFNGLVLCSRATKAMLLRLQTEKSRLLLERGAIDRPRYKYANLWPRSVVVDTTIADKRRAKRRTCREEQWVDHVRTMEYDTPETFYAGKDAVTITMLDANHCPGSSMFLIQNDATAILHTGDVRADAPFTTRLRSHPAVQPFVRDACGVFDRAAAMSQDDGEDAQPRLERIYLDTAMFLGTGDVPSRADAIASLIETMRKYPLDAHWFFECFTWGYEEVLKAVHQAFGQQIHVDRYKHVIFDLHRELDPALTALATADPTSRFHACELRSPCTTCRERRAAGALVVRVSFPEVKLADFDVRHAAVVREVEAAARGEAAWPLKLLCPAARHSPLPELQSLVRLFRPRNLSPNALLYALSLGAKTHTTIPVRGADYYAMVSLFGDCLAAGGRARLAAEAVDYGARFELPTRANVEDNFRTVFGVESGGELSVEALDEVGVGIDHVSLEGYGGGPGPRLAERADSDDSKPLRYTTGPDRRSNRTLYAQAALGGPEDGPGASAKPSALRAAVESVPARPRAALTAQSRSKPAIDQHLSTDFQHTNLSRTSAASTMTSTPSSTATTNRYRASPATIAMLSRRRQERRESSASAARD